MNPLQKYADLRAAIHCPTYESAEKVNRWIVELGGRNLTYNHNVYNSDTCYGMNDVKKGYNAYGSKEWYERNNYEVISFESLEQKEVSSYQIF